MSDTLSTRHGSRWPVTILICAVAAAGVGSTALGFSKRCPGLIIAGATLAVLASMIYCTRLLVDTVARYLQPAEDAYKHGNQVGYDRGWIEGRNAGRPQVVTDLDRFRNRSG